MLIHFQGNRQSGATLLETLFLLAVAGLIVIMSVRFYASSAAKRHNTQMLSQVQSIISVADSQYQGNYSYEDDVSTTTITNVLGASRMKTPWGKPITISGAEANSYDVTFEAVPADACREFLISLKAMEGIYVGTTCPEKGTVDVKYTYYRSRES